MSKTRIDLCDGKYSVCITPEEGQYEALRYGEPWRSFVGDHLISSMFHRIVELEEQVETNKQEAETNKREAELYKWLRAQHWSDNTLCVVANPRESVKPGRLCPSGDLLDSAIKVEMVKEAGGGAKIVELEL